MSINKRIESIMPIVSVIIPSYNHEIYIEECLNSVLHQTFQNFEIIITDDGSKDQTIKNIQQIRDPRIKLFRHYKNKGACVAANNCIKHSTGKYIAMLSSDDIWLPEKLETQVDFLENNPEIGAVFGRVEWIDDNGGPIADDDFPYKHLFDVTNRSRYAWLNHFFFEGNCLCHPSSLIRRECFTNVGMYNPAFANLPDFDLWVRLCQEYDIHVLKKKVIKYRWFQNNTNASSDTDKNRIRIRYELRKITNHYLNISNTDEFIKIFPDASIYAPITPFDIPFLLGIFAISTDLEVKVLWGLDTIFEYLQDEKSAQKIQSNHEFTYLDFIELTGEHDVFKVGASPNPPHETMMIDQNLNKELPNTLKSLMKPINNQIKKIRRRLRLKTKLELLKQTQLFDSVWYLKKYSDVSQAKIDPARHYLLYGGFEGRDPSSEFSSQWYLDTYDDVRQSGINPLVHYLVSGIHEGRKIYKSKSDEIDNVDNSRNSKYG